MKTPTFIRSHAGRLLCWLAVLALSGLTYLACADSPRAQALREKAAAMEQKARDLKADGHGEQAQQVMAEVRELLACAGKMEQAAPGDREQGMAERVAMKQELAELQAEVRELRAAGKLDQAAEVKQHALELQRVLEETADRPPMKRPELQGPRPGERPGPMPPEAVEMQQRLRHLQVAIDNLHAAGLHEPAERLAQEKERMMDRMRADAGPGREMREQMERLQNQIQELRRALEDLRGQFEELRREQR